MINDLTVDKCDEPILVPIVEDRFSCLDCLDFDHKLKKKLWKTQKSDTRLIFKHIWKLKYESKQSEYDARGKCDFLDLTMNLLGNMNIIQCAIFRDRYFVVLLIVIIVIIVILFL